MTSARKGARRMADIPADTLAALSRGEIETRSLPEALALNQRILLETVFPTLPATMHTALEAVYGLGILKRMQGIGALLWQHLGEAALATCLRHHSDTVRGWAAFMLSSQPDVPTATRLQHVRPLADDAHFAVREWAWMALRPHLAEDLPQAFSLLQPWTAEPSANLRRFAAEVLRPRGVWCSHIAALKRDPSPALPLLTALNADPSRYVQDSVANWLNDAAKDQPDWVRGVCENWSQNRPSPATVRVCQRAQRSLK